MQNNGIELVGKIGSMALISREDNDMDYNIIARIGRELRPGMVWVSSGAPMLLVFQAVQGYRPPVWPWEADKQAQMMHFDFYVDDLDAAVEQAVACGATLSEVQFFESSRTLFDPAGHPFCLSTTWEEQLYAK